MKVKELILLLKKQDQNLDVLFQDPNSHGGPFSVGSVREQESQGEYPDDFEMPEGYKFVLLRA